MDNDRLKAWWDSLTEEQQAEALSAQRQGRLTPRLLESLQDADAMPSGSGAKGSGSLPGEVERFLKARH